MHCDVYLIEGSVKVVIAPRFEISFQIFEKKKENTSVLKVLCHLLHNLEQQISLYLSSRFTSNHDFNLSSGNFLNITEKFYGQIHVSVK
jgi:hypothetical protein